jgi:pre-mRNA-splicing factor SYF1
MPLLSFQLDESDILYEEEIIKNKYSPKVWLRYLDYKKDSPQSVRNLIYERALKEIPGSYKVWYAYLRERRGLVRYKSPLDPTLEDLNNAYERCLVFLHKMPRLWTEYLTFMSAQHKITKTRRLFDRCLRALPITQHHRIWPLYLKFVRQYNIPETTVRICRRYLQLEPYDVEDYIDYLKSVGKFDEAATRLATVVNDDHFASKRGKTPHQFWTELCELLSTNAAHITSLKAEPIIRSGLVRFTDMVGHLWVALAEHFTRLKLFEKARDIYEEALSSVMTVRDFTLVFDAYSQFEELLLRSLFENLGLNEQEPVDDVDLDLKVARFENLMDRRPILLSSVLLRQNPHNVNEWLKRALLFSSNPLKVIETYTKAVHTVDPHKATGKLCELWISFAKFYEEHDQLHEARAVFDKAVTRAFKKYDELATVWCEYVEMELRNKEFRRAVSLIKQATNQHVRLTPGDPANYVRSRLYRSLKIWQLYLDLEESFGTFESVKSL